MTSVPGAQPQLTPARAVREIRPLPPRPLRSPTLRFALLVAIALWSLEFLPIFDVQWFPWQMRPWFLAPLLVAMVYAAERTLLYHPLYNPAHLAWLHATPWRAPAPLPLGPVTPAPLDVSIVALLALASAPADPIRAPLAVISASAATYAAVLLPILSASGLHRHVYTLLILAGAAILTRKMESNIPALTILAAIALGIASHGAARSLRRPPVDLDQSRPIEPGLGAHFLQSMQQSKSKKKEPPSHLGWPYTALAPRDPRPALSRERALLIPLVVGWLMFAAVTVSDDRDPVPVLFGPIVACFVAIFRLSIYLTGHTRPLTILGRITHGRPIIRRFDIVFIAPCSAVVVAFILAHVLDVELGAPVGLSFAAPITASLWIVLLCPPTYGQWNLTGGHRLTPTKPGSSPALLERAGPNPSPADS